VENSSTNREPIDEKEADNHIRIQDMKNLSLADPILTEDEIRALEDVIKSGWITMGERVREFEREFAIAHSTDDAIAVASCTAALHLLLIALGASRGDEVLVPSLTFVATANAARYVGAKPVMVDIESLECPHIDVSDAEKKLSQRTKAVVVMHYGGWTCNMRDWRKFADEHGLALIEDAAHAPGHPEVGKYGDAVAFSFYGNKNMTTAEGGMVIARNPHVRDAVRTLRSHGMTSVTLDRYVGHAHSYDVTDLGFNYRMDELRAAVGRVQLAKLAGWNRKRRALLARYRAGFEALLKGAELPFHDDEYTTAHILPVLLPRGADRRMVMESLRRDGIHSSIHYPPIHRFTEYVRTMGVQKLPKTEEFSDRELSLPIHPAMNNDDVDYVIDCLSRLV